MSQGDRRLVQNTRERLTSADINDLQSLSAAEKAGLLRAWYNDRLGDWYLAPGLQSQVSSSSPSLVGDVYGGLMVQPDNAAYFLVQPGAAGFLDPTGVSTYDNPYRVVVDPGVAIAGLLPFTSNAGGGAPRWDVIECQVADVVLAQENRYIFNPSTGIATPELVDKVRAGRLTYRVRTGTVGAGFPGLAAGWMPLAVCCAPAGSSSLLTSDVWDVRPLVRERTQRRFTVDVSTGDGYSPNKVADYRLNSQTENKWIGVSEGEFNGYPAGGQLLRSTPSTLAQFGLTTNVGGRFGSLNIDLADNQSAFTPASDSFFYLVALFPHLLPRWQRYSQVAIGSGRVPTGPRGFLVATTIKPGANGIVKSVPMPTAAQFGGGSTFAGACLGVSAFSSGSIPQRASAAAHVHELTYSRSLAAVVSGATFRFSYVTTHSGDHFPPHARRVKFHFSGVTDNLGGSTFTQVLVECLDLSSGSVVYAVPLDNVRQQIPSTNGAAVDFEFWAPILPRLMPSDVNGLTGGMRIDVAYFTAGSVHVSATLRAMAWSADD
jgi:hypothetical protein